MDWSPWSGLEGTAYLHWNVKKAASEGACELAMVLQSLLDVPDLVHRTRSSALGLGLQSYVVLGWVGLAGPVARRSWDGGLARRSCGVVGLDRGTQGLVPGCWKGEVFAKSFGIVYVTLVFRRDADLTVP